jgi:hypothetical protein
MKIVDADHRIAALNELVAKVGADESGSACDERSMAAARQ